MAPEQAENDNDIPPTLPMIRPAARVLIIEPDAKDEDETQPA